MAQHSSNSDFESQFEMDFISRCSSVVASAITTLRQLAGSTEHEFLQIGARMQKIYQSSSSLPQTAHHFVDLASEKNIPPLVDQLMKILQEMGNYLDQMQHQSSNSCTTLGNVEALLRQIATPLEGFKKMSKNLYILEVFIKIESAYLGEMSGEFVNLALDIKKLTQQIKQKSGAIYDLSRLLTGMISKNISEIGMMNSTQDAKGRLTLSEAAESIAQLTAVNQRFSQLGQMISNVSEENARSISGVVQSMQIHDIFRQRVEHVIEALEGLSPSLLQSPQDSGVEEQNYFGKVIGKIGDVCELQEAQLRLASDELHKAVGLIIDNLINISHKQKHMVRDITSQSGMINTSGGSFIDDVGYQMSSITGLLAACSDMNEKFIGIMDEVTTTVNEITGSVSDIENISHEIIQIALNARIKASCTGTEGDSLSALAEEIGQVSAEAVQRTDTITTTLTEVHSTTEALSSETDSNEHNLKTRLTNLKTESGNILGILKKMSSELQSLLKQIRNQANIIEREIETVAGKIDVHERIKDKTDQVLGNLKEILVEARKRYPATAAFKEDMKLMTQRYTMESERRIHESIANMQQDETIPTERETPQNSQDTDSEFGDNVELF